MFYYFFWVTIWLDKSNGKPLTSTLTVYDFVNLWDHPLDLYLVESYSTGHPVVIFGQPKMETPNFA